MGLFFLIAMAAARPLVQVWNAEGKETSQQALPSVFTSPIRSDVVQFVHTNVNKNSRQAYAVSEKAGHQTSAESWGTGRAVARIPRVPGGGTHRAGQAAFGNMCRGGRMFAPTKTWRRWHRRVNLNQKRMAVCSALAASALPSLVMARGHSIDNVPEVPLVISNDAVSGSEKTKAAVALLKAINAYDDVEKSGNSKKLRAGQGKRRNRRFVRHVGPLVVYDESGHLLVLSEIFLVLKLVKFLVLIYFVLLLEVILVDLSFGLKVLSNNLIPFLELLKLNLNKRKDTNFQLLKCLILI